MKQGHYKMDTQCTKEWIKFTQLKKRMRARERRRERERRYCERVWCVSYDQVREHNPWEGEREREREEGRERGRVGEKLDEIPLPQFFFLI